jgi:carbamoyltransferase
MVILGIASEHCSAAALMIDGRIVGMIQEERLSKRKNQVAFPLQAIRRLIARHLAGDSTRIDRVVFGGRESDPYYAALDRFSDFSVADHVREQHELWYPHFYDNKRNDGTYWQGELAAGRHINVGAQYDFSWLRTMAPADAAHHFVEVERPAAVKRHLGFSGPVEAINHHTCHAYYALHGGALDSLQREEALVLTADAWGDGRNWSASVADAQGRLTPVAGGADHRVARIYKWTTLILSMKPNEHEYKVMGLSAYPRPGKYISAAERIFFEALDFRDGKFV